ncbi:hypothetical protein K3152_01145 [Qipengyuania sp. 1NDH17]|uniref:Uncharacterized protein n=1 Tax=Qipengyuania polymorpha TaxID=2867234 RepID=A0ABS7IU04_9SPHN|nr:hypothetical protein [Qipengyuania polymorpha]MBX7456844.1 hypothetical protein [Qipengyuania polymorpha]
MKKLALALSATLMLAGTAADAQQRVQAQQPQPRQPGYEAPKMNPVLTELKALRAHVDALEERAGKQILVFHFSQGQAPGESENDYQTNQQNAAMLCEQFLKDRYGRVVSYRIHSANGFFYFSHLLCETKP